MYKLNIFFAVSSFILVAVSLQTASGFADGVSETNNSTCPNFYHQHGAVNDHRVFRIFHDGILALKVVREDERGSVVQQTDGISLVIAIYLGGHEDEHLAVCNVVNQETQIQVFMEHFYGQPDVRPKLGQCTTIEQIVKTFEGTVVGPTAGNVTLVPQDMASLLKQCQGMHRNFEHNKEQQDHKHNELDGSKDEKPIRTKNGRQRRQILPGTKWCGVGNVADGPGDYGYFRDADKCCEQHDNCRPLIGKFRLKYNIFNWRPWAILHCNCDDQFYNCLKDTGGIGAWMVGQSYFNGLSPPCFTLKQKKICFWGSCLKKEKSTDCDSALIPLLCGHG